MTDTFSSLEELNKYWLDKGNELIAKARLEEPALAAWPDTWVAANLMTVDNGTEWELSATQVIDSEHALAVKPAGDVEALLEAALAAEDKIAALEAAWRACFAPELAEVIEALDAHRDAPAMPVAKKKKDTEALWIEAAKTARPRSMFAGEWPKQWRGAQCRMRPLYERARSPLFAAAAIDFAKRDPLPYTSIASTTYWKAHAWFIAEQGDVRQVAALEAFEKRIAKQGGADKTCASTALASFKPRELSAKAKALLSKLAVPAKPAAKPKLSLASAEERSVAADALQLAGDPRGEFITVQEQIAKKPTPELIKQQAKLLKKHAKQWVPGTIYRDSCVFRGGVPVAGHVMCRSDPELGSMAGSEALATFETLIIDRAFAMGDISPGTIAEVVASLPNLRCVITSDEGAMAIARGAPTNLERIVIEGDRAAPFDGPGVPKLTRVDAAALKDSWVKKPWFARLTALGITDPADWTEWRHDKLAPAIVFTDGMRWLHRHTPSEDTPWELWADAKGKVTAKPQAGSTGKSLLATLDRIASWKGVDQLYVPENFISAILRKTPKVDVSTIAAVDPATLGISLDLL